MPSLPSTSPALLARLPRGASLDDGAFAARHRNIWWVLVAHVPTVAMVGVLGPKGIAPAVGWIVALALLAAGAKLCRGRGMQASLTSLGLLVASAALIQLTGGLIEMHFHIFVSLALVAIYQQWAALLVAIAFTVVHHIGMSLYDGNAVFDHHAAQHAPVVWALIHAVFVVVEVIVILVWWAAAEASERRGAEAQVEAERARESEYAQRLENERATREVAEEQARVAQHREATVAKVHAEAEQLAVTANEVDRNVQQVATAMNELTSSIREIVRGVTEASDVASRATAEAQRTTDMVTRLGEASDEIGRVLEVITKIAGQTNLLALNATIEAARAGESGKGFAVVAHEVKELATQTAKAASEINGMVQGIQGDTSSAIAAIEGIRGVIARIDELQHTIAGAVHEQSATADQVAESVSEAAYATRSITTGAFDLAESARAATA